MAPFRSGIAIGPGISLTVLLVLTLLFLVAYIGEWIIALIAAIVSVGRDGMRAERARIDLQRAEVGLPPLDRRELALNLCRAWRMLRHPIRGRALIAESFRALKNPVTHKWSDGLS
jgi:hypothetical protein